MISNIHIPVHPDELATARAFFENVLGYQSIERSGSTCFLVNVENTLSVRLRTLDLDLHDASDLARASGATFIVEDLAEATTQFRLWALKWGQNVSIDEPSAGAPYAFTQVIFNALDVFYSGIGLTVYADI